MEHLCGRYWQECERMCYRYITIFHKCKKIMGNWQSPIWNNILHLVVWLGCVKRKNWPNVNLIFTWIEWMNNIIHDSYLDIAEWYNSKKIARSIWRTFDDFVSYLWHINDSFFLISPIHQRSNYSMVIMRILQYKVKVDDSSISR